MMKCKLFSFILIMASLCGCASLNNNVVMSSLPTSNTSFLINKTQPTDYPGYMAAQGNIYSCRYGIHAQSEAEFSPPKATMFAALLVKALPSISKYSVVLERFDVYENNRLANLHVAGSAIGGIIGAAIVSTGNINKDVYTFKNLIVDINPIVKRSLSENQVGCDDAREGEYYASEISGGHRVVVTWLKFRVNNKPYHFRTFYQFQPTAKYPVAEAISEAIRLSVEAAASMIAPL